MYEQNLSYMRFGELVSTGRRKRASRTRERGKTELSYGVESAAKNG